MSRYSNRSYDKSRLAEAHLSREERLDPEIATLRREVANLRKREAENKELIEKLQQKCDRYCSIIENSLDLIFQCDRQGQFTFVNAAWERTLGFTCEELLRHRLSDLQTRDVAQRDARSFSKIMLKGHPIEGYETTLIARNGQPVYLRFNIVPLRDFEGCLTGMQGIAYNVSDQKRIEDEHLRIQKLESIGTLAGGIAHDFNNLLQAILGNIQLAKRGLDPGDRLFTWLASAEKAGEQAKDLSYRLLTFAKGGKPFRQVQDISALVRETVQLVLSGSNIAADFLLDTNLYALEIDEGQMKQVISNIVLNAKDFMPRGGRITVRANNVPAHQGSDLPRKDRNYVHISIEDQGIGISPAHLHRVFDPYFTTKRMGSEKGKGLGLTVCHSIITRHDGVIRIDSVPAMKTTVHIYLPQASEVPRPTQKYSAGPIQKKRRVLLMDDEDSVRTVTKEMLTQLGYEVKTAQDGEEAIDEYLKALNRGAAFDVVILDLTVPGGTGADEAILKLLEIDPNVRAILASGYADNNIMNDYREFGFSAALAKPFDLNELAAIVASVADAESL